MFRSELKPDADVGTSVVPSMDGLPFTWEVKTADAIALFPQGDTPRGDEAIVLVRVLTSDSHGVSFKTKHGSCGSAQRREAGKRTVEHLVVFGREDGPIQIFVWGLHKVWEGTFWIRPDSRRVEIVAFGLVDRERLDGVLQAIR